MDSVKIHKSERQRKKQNRQKSNYVLTPPKYNTKTSVYNTVRRMEKKMGYDFDCPEHEIDPRLRKQRQQFREKAAKYWGGKEFCKKQTRFDKMRSKEQLGFKAEELPIKRQLRKVDTILSCFLKKQALLALMR